MTPQLVDHAHTDSCAAIGCKPRATSPRNEHVYFWYSHTTVAIVNKAIGLLTGHQTVCSHVSFAQWQIMYQQTMAGEQRYAIKGSYMPLNCSLMSDFWRFTGLTPREFVRLSVSATNVKFSYNHDTSWSLNYFCTAYVGYGKTRLKQSNTQPWSETLQFPRFKFRKVVQKH